MGLIELILIAVSLSMDAFAVSICKGLSLKKATWKNMGIAGLWFGGFQALMPLIGYLLANLFSGFVENYTAGIAFILLAWIGGKMIWDSFHEEEDSFDGSMSVGSMFVLALATSIDALAVGITFAFLNVNIWSSIVLIGLTTFLFSAIGVKIGSVFGAKYRNKATLAGGIVLILIGLKILLEGLGIL
ncbi:hypothetical protein C815_00228 [Firmicutes bacterium M10-2]|nr:hypothetical protein C815_00228 [Firmicutes bacterium M10-2]